MLKRLLFWLILSAAGKEAVRMLVRLYAGEIIDEKITLDKVPSKLRPEVEAYLRDFGYPIE